MRAIPSFRLILGSMLVVTLLGASAQAETCDARISSLTVDAVTKTGKSIPEILKNWQTVSDEDVDDVKEELKARLVDAGFPSAAKFKVSDLQVGYTETKMIQVSGRSAVGWVFSVQLDPDGAIRLFSIDGGEALASKVRASEMFGIAPSFEAAVRSLDGIFPHGLSRKDIARVEPTHNGEFYLRVEIATAPGRFTSLGLYANGKVMVFGQESDEGGTRITRGNLGLRLCLNSAAQDSHIDAAVYSELKTKKPSGLDSRISALYDALAMLMADKRCDIAQAATREVGRARGSGPIRGIFIDPNSSNISYGTVKLESSRGEQQSLTFFAGHIDIGRDLDEANAWLTGEGNVGDHVGFYKQLKNDPKLCRF